ncbi:hypothetical protein D1872_228440 [compost metagenome]
MVGKLDTADIPPVRAVTVNFDGQFQWTANVRKIEKPVSILKITYLVFRMEVLKMSESGPPYRLQKPFFRIAMPFQQSSRTFPLPHCQVFFHINFVCLSETHACYLPVYLGKCLSLDYQSKADRSRLAAIFDAMDS